ncbi:hypothetical protein VL20_193 [Microcystis panniformis FACHB-1757]|uniref:Mobile element protein n=1 Tax=Microcystis panniformis FACHB-1757 TaxID=1638788 RepID=A0A0K1RUI5_9CHRO|nr:hypothetical protein VL20_193 [Microcystis panniformis FACHB-1757]
MLPYRTIPSNEEPGFLRENSLLKLGFTSDFIAQSKLLGGRTPQTPRVDS